MGSPGLYDVVFVLGVPGIKSVKTKLDFEALIADGDSLLKGAELRVNLDSNSSNVARLVPNTQGRLAQVHLTVTADSFSTAEKEAHDQIMVVLSRIAFEADTPLEATAVLLTEQTTQTRTLGATIIGTVQPAPTLSGSIGDGLRSLLAAYREGLNSNSPLYQALSFYKVIEGVETFRISRARAAKNGGQAQASTLPKVIPSHAKDLPEMTEWVRSLFTPYLGMTFAEVKGSLKDTMRNAVVHLNTRRDIRIADYLNDIQACRDIVPILRYMARDLITEEIAVSAASHAVTQPNITPST
ncbi:MAG: methylamine utilization protein MauJ [Ferrimicrobium sp.]